MEVPFIRFMFILFYRRSYKYEKGTTVASFFFLGFWWMINMESLMVGNIDLTYYLTVAIFLLLAGLLLCQWYRNYRKYRKELEIWEDDELV